jgi:hypothetical protein
MCRSDFASCRVTHHGRETFEKAAKAGSCEPFVSQPDAESFNGVGYDAGVEGLELVDLVGR